MSDQDQAAKTEPPSTKRLTESRQRGQVAQSRDVGHFALLGAIGAIVLLAPWTTARLASIGAGFLERCGELAVDPSGLHRLATELVGALGRALAVPLLILVGVALGVGYLQVGGLISGQSLIPSFARISPLAGLARLFSLRSVIELVKGVVKVGAVGGAGFALIWPEMARIDSYAGGDPAQLPGALAALTKHFLIAAILIMAAVAVLDFFYQRFAFLRRLRMTKQELVDEQKNQEGDPRTKARRRRLRIGRAKARMMAAVPKATVIVTNPTHYAVALKYDRSMRAPRLLAKGCDLVALRIRDVARQNLIPVVENAAVARLLYAAVEIDQEIPPEHYRAVAEIITYVMRVKRAAVGAAI